MSYTYCDLYLYCLVLTHPAGVANEDVTQHIEVLAGDGAKLSWLAGHLADFIDSGDVLVFAGQKAKVDELLASFQSAGVKAAAIHGDMDQVSELWRNHHEHCGTCFFVHVINGQMSKAHD